MTVEMVPLETLGRVVSGATPRTTVPEYWGGNIPWVTPADLSGQRDLYFFGPCRRITQAGFASCSTSMLPEGSVLFSSRAPIGHCAITTFELCTNQGFKSVVPGPDLDPLYALFALRYLTDEIVHAGRGATFDEVNQEMMGATLFPYRPLSEQREIAHRLRAAEELLAAYTYKRQLDDALPASVYRRLFLNGSSYPVATVAELAQRRKASIRAGPFGSQLLHSEFATKGDVAVLGIDNAVNNDFEWGKARFISESRFAELRRYEVFPGDVLITIMATCGRCAVVPATIPRAINTKHLCCISLDQDRCLPEYLHGAFLYDPGVQEQMAIATRGSIMDGLNMEIIQSLLIPVPPLPIQETYTRAVLATRGLTSVDREQCRQASHIYDALLGREFAVA